MLKKSFTLARWATILLVHLFVLLLVLSPVGFSQPAPQTPGQSMQLSPQTALERVLTASPLQGQWFEPAFLNQVPLTQVQDLIASLQKQFGAYQRVQAEGDRFLVLFERGRVTAQIALNAQGQIAGLLFQPAAEPLTLDAAIAQLRTFPGEVNFLVLENGSELASFNGDRPLAVGSAFKLAVLVALRQQIDSGQHQWHDVVQLRPAWKSLPSGILQEWPDGSLLTLQTLATLMISISDNTATDALIHSVGRDAVEALTDRNRPLLTTRELFTLKASQHQNWLQRYQVADLAQRRQLLEAIATYPLPDIHSEAQTREGFFAGQPTALDVEYFFTPHELCHLMAKVQDLPLMSINPGTGLVNPQDWLQVAYKGGSEPGVLNLTHWLKSRAGKTYCVVTTWNNSAAPLEELRLYTLHSAVLQYLQTTRNR